MEQSLEAGQPFSKEKLLQSTQALSLLVQKLPSNFETEAYRNLWQKILEARYEVIALIYSYGRNSEPSATVEPSAKC